MVPAQQAFYRRGQGRGGGGVKFNSWAKSN